MTKTLLLRVLTFVSVIAMLFAAVPAPNTEACDTKTIYMKGEGACEGDGEWHFVINQIADSSLAPDKIWIAWSDGTIEEVPLDKFTGGVAHYQTTSHGWNADVVGGWTYIYDDWDGQFNLSHRPCYTACTETADPVYGPWGDWQYNPSTGNVCRYRDVTVYDKYITDHICDQWSQEDCSYQKCDETVGPQYGDWSDWAWNEDRESVCRSRTITYVDKYTGEPCSGGIEWDCSYEPCAQTTDWVEVGRGDWTWDESALKWWRWIYYEKYDLHIQGHVCDTDKVKEWKDHDLCECMTDWVEVSATDWTFDPQAQKWFRKIFYERYDCYIPAHVCDDRTTTEWKEHELCTETTDWIIIHETDWTWDEATQRWYKDITEVKYDKYVAEHECDRRVRQEWKDHTFCECMTDWVQVSATDWQWDEQTQKWFRDVSYERYDCQVPDHICGTDTKREWKDHDFCVETTDWVIVDVTDWTFDPTTQKWYRDVTEVKYDKYVAEHECDRQVRREWKDYECCECMTDWVQVSATDWTFDPQTHRWYRDVSYARYDCHISDHVCDKKVEREWREYEYCQEMTDWVLVKSTDWQWDEGVGDYFRLFYYERYDIHVKDHVCDHKVVKEWMGSSPGSVAGCVDLKGQQLKAVGPAPQNTVHKSRSASFDGEVLTISGLEPGTYLVSAPGHGPETLKVLSGQTAKAPWDCVSSRPFQLESGLSPGLTSAVVETSSCPSCQEDIRRKVEELAAECGWTGDPCPEVRDDYLPDAYHTSAKMLWATGESKDIPERGLYFKITALYERTMGALIQFAGYGRWDTEVFGDLVQIYFDKGPAHQIAPGYSSHWAQIMGEGGQRGRVNIREDLTGEDNSILVATLNAAAEAFRRWEVALGLEVGKPEACYLSSLGWQNWLVDTSTVYESPYGFWSPMVTPNQILWANLECGFWGCYYPSADGAWEFGFTQTQTHAFFTDGNGNLLIPEEDRLKLIRAVPQVKMDGERVLVEEADVQRFLATFARILYKNGLGAYVTRVPPAWQEYVGFAGSGTDFAYLAHLDAEAQRLADFAAEAQAGLDAWYARNPGQEASAELLEAVQAAHDMANNAASLLESERERLLGQFPKAVP